MFQFWIVSWTMRIHTNFYSWSKLICILYVYLSLFLFWCLLQQLVGYLIFNTAPPLCDLHLQAFELSSRKPPSSVAQCFVSLNVFPLKIYSRKLPPTGLQRIFYFEWSRANCKLTKRRMNHNECKVIFNVSYRALMAPNVFSWAQLHLCSLTERK